MNKREGKRYLGEVNVDADIAGDAEIIANFKDVVVAPGEFVSATATKLGFGYVPLGTSEFQYLSA